MAKTRQEQYDGIVKRLRKLHGELIKLEQEGKLNDARENAALIGEYVVKLRLSANLLFRFKNDLVDQMNEATKKLASTRQLLYEEQIHAKKSASAADSHAKNMTRELEAEKDVLKNQVGQVNDEIERFNGIVIVLQSRMREFNTERMVDR